MEYWESWNGLIGKMWLDFIDLRVFEFYVLLQRSLRPIGFLANFNITSKFPFDFLGGSPHSLLFFHWWCFHSAREILLLFLSLTDRYWDPREFASKAILFLMEDSHSLRKVKAGDVQPFELFVILEIALAAVFCWPFILFSSHLGVGHHTMILHK